MQHVLSDLVETRIDNPHSGLTTHSYLWQGHGVLFYSPATRADFGELMRLGGITDHYLSHRDEAGPMLKAVAEQFGARLHAPAAELADIEPYAPVDVPLAGRHTDQLGIEVIPTPGHSPGSTCYRVIGADGEYLFTGDTLFSDSDGRLRAGYLDFMHTPADAVVIADSLQVLADLTPDIVISSAYSGDPAVTRIEAGRWRDAVDHAIAGLPL